MQKEVFEVRPRIVILPGHFQGPAKVITVDIIGGVAGFYPAEYLGVVPHGSFDVT